MGDKDALRLVLEFVFDESETNCTRYCVGQCVHKRAQYLMNWLLSSGELHKLEILLNERKKEEMKNGIQASTDSSGNGP